MMYGKMVDKRPPLKMRWDPGARSVPIDRNPRNVEQGPTLTGDETHSAEGRGSPHAVGGGEF